MAYTAKSASLAPVAKKLSTGAMEKFVDAANVALAAGGDHNACVMAGWAALRKDEPSAGDAHVDVPLGEDGKKPKKKPDEDAVDKAFEIVTEFVKVDEGLGLVFGWAIVCKVDGADYYDLQGDHIPEEAMLNAVTDFMSKSRVAKDMHDGDQIGDIVFAWPLTTEMAKALDITTRQTGFLIGMRPSADVLAKYKSGERRGYSIGGYRVRDEEVA